MSAADFLAQEKIWFDKPRYDEAERRFYEHMNGGARPTHTPKVTRTSVCLPVTTTVFTSETHVMSVLSVL